MLTASTADHDIDIRIQEKRYYSNALQIIYHDIGNGWTLVSTSAWKTRSMQS